MRLVLPFLAAAALIALPSAAPAQQSDRVVDVYGDDACPNSNGQEIVVCRRHTEGDRYRIPQDLRQTDSRPQALGSSAVTAVNATGGAAKQVQSCDAVGAGVNAGCWKKQIDAARAERRRDAKEGESIP